MKESKVEEFLRKVDRPWGMSMTELEQFQSEVKQLKSENQKIIEQYKKYDSDFKSYMKTINNLTNNQSKVAVEKLEQVKEELLREWVPIEVAKVLGPYVIKIKEMIKELKGESE